MECFGKSYGKMPRCKDCVITNSCYRKYHKQKKSGPNPLKFKRVVVRPIRKKTVTRSAYNEQYYIENKEKCKEASKNWQKENPERYKEIQKKSREKNRIKDFAAQKRWREANREQYNKKRAEISLKKRMKNNPQYYRRQEQKEAIKKQILKFLNCTISTTMHIYDHVLNMGFDMHYKTMSRLLNSLEEDGLIEKERLINNTGCKCYWRLNIQKFNK